MFFFFSGTDTRQARDEKSVRVPSVQDEGTRTNLHLDFQLKDTGQALQMGSGWSCPSPANLMHAMQSNAISISILKMSHCIYKN